LNSACASAMGSEASSTRESRRCSSCSHVFDPSSPAVGAVGDPADKTAEASARPNGRLARNNDLEHVPRPQSRLSCEISTRPQSRISGNGDANIRRLSPTNRATLRPPSQDTNLRLQGNTYWGFEISARPPSRTISNQDVVTIKLPLSPAAGGTLRPADNASALRPSSRDAGQRPVSRGLLGRSGASCAAHGKCQEEDALGHAGALIQLPSAGVVGTNCGSPSKGRGSPGSPKSRMSPKARRASSAAGGLLRPPGCSDVLRVSSRHRMRTLVQAHGLH